MDLEEGAGICKVNGGEEMHSGRGNYLLSIESDRYWYVLEMESSFVIRTK